MKSTTNTHPSTLERVAHLDDNHTNEELRIIRRILERAHPEPDSSLGQKIYANVQRVVKYLGIPALIIAAIVPVYDLAKGIRSSLSKDLLVEVYTDYAVDLLQDGYVDRAEAVLGSLNKIEKMSSRVHYTEAKISVSQALLKARNIQQTEDLIQILLVLNKRSDLLTGAYGDPDDYYRLKLMLSEVKISRADYDGAMTVLSSVDKEIDKAPGEIIANYHLKKGTVYVWRHEHEKADIELSKAKNILTSKGTHAELLAEASFQIAKNDQFRGNFDAAIEGYLTAKTMFESEQSYRGQINSLNNLGMIYFSHIYPERDNKKALAYYTSALQVAEQIDDLVAKARARYNIAGIKLNQRDVHGALQDYILAFEDFKNSGNVYGITASHSSLGKIYGILGEYEKDYYHAKEALDGFVKIKDKKNIGEQAGELAEAAKSLGNNKDFVIYNYLAYIYRRASKDTRLDKNLSILKMHKENLDAEIFIRHLKEAQVIAKEINLKLLEPNIDLSIPDGI